MTTKHLLHICLQGIGVAFKEHGRESQICLRKSRDLPQVKTWLLMMDEHSNVGSIPIQVIVENSTLFFRAKVGVQVRPRPLV